jgi:NADH:ubiquinone oxidoreductase subunit F (NADH-binding)
VTVSRVEIAERARRSFFADLHAPEGAARVCRGTSCALALGLVPPRPPAAGVRPVHCLGYCHRSPARLSAAGHVECEPAPAEEVRCAAPRAVVTARLARGDFSELARAREAGVWSALERAVAGEPEAVLAAVEASGERGRGGASFPTGRKWRAAAVERGPRVVIANGDEGDPGSFVDRLLMERDPHAVLEGLALCGFAVGAAEGIVYVRSEYPEAFRRLETAAREARAAGLLGPRSASRFDVRVESGHGSYVCGEETALIESLEGRRGEAQPRPPYPVERGFLGRPTVVNNVETLVAVPWIAAEGAAAYRSLGASDCPGTKALCFNHGFARPGVVEVEIGTSLRRAIDELGGGARDGRPLAAILLGGPMGSVLRPEAWDVPIDPVALAARGIQLGHGGIVALPRETNWRALLVHLLDFMAEESCGRCVPCRLGSRRALELAQRQGEPGAGARLRELLELVRDTSLCGFGQGVPVPAAQLLELAETSA